VENDEASLKSTPTKFIKAELSSLQHSLFFVLKEGNEAYVPYTIENLSSSTIYYRQKGCEGHPWLSLRPGSTTVYVWEEPLKPKRLVVRVAVDSGSTRMRQAGGEVRVEQSKQFSGLFRHVQDEDDLFFPPVSVKLEEIGFRDRLACGFLQDTGTTRYLDLKVEVSGSARSLVCQDATTEVELILGSLRTLCGDEEERIAKLRGLNDVQPSDDIRNTVGDRAASLMSDFPDQIIKSRHQVLVQVIEAAGLSPDTLVGTCNPYCFVSYKNAAKRRFFGRRVTRQTYFIRKTVNPIWNSQTFVFDVPEQAVLLPRGHKLTIELRNFQVLGSDKELGRATVELHTLKSQQPIVGWFPLAGKTGQLELENSLSYWGRGSVKLRVQWIYSTPALVDYFSLVAEKRLEEIRHSYVGMTHLLEKKKATAASEKHSLDGFKRVRAQDLLSSFSRQKTGFKALKLVRPRLSRQEKASVDANQSARNVDSKDTPPRGTPSRKSGKLLQSRSPHSAAASARKSKEKLQEVLAKKRRVLQAVLSATHLRYGRPPSVTFHRESSGEYIVSGLRTWSAATLLFSDLNLLTKVDGDHILISMREVGDLLASQNDFVRYGGARVIAMKMVLPSPAPSTMLSSQSERLNAYIEARSSFERAARRKLKSTLHPGGWLLLVPETALNLSENFSGMYVKFVYENQVVCSESVPAKVNPKWRAKSNNDDENIPIRIEPRVTSGTIRVSVVGEKSHANITTRTELGVVELPLGNVIAACVEAAEENLTLYEEMDGTLIAPSTYVRWFPLAEPKDTIPVDGDLGLSSRPLETEKTSDCLFREYFQPVLKLQLIWLADDEESQADEQHVSCHESMLQGSAGWEPVATEPEPKKEAAESLVAMYSFADFFRFSLSLIDNQRSFELLNLSLSGIGFKFWLTLSKTRLNATIEWIQIDQQDEDAREPIILAPTPTDYMGPVIQVLAALDNSRSVGNVRTFDFFDVSVAEMDVTLEENIIFDVFNFFTAIRARRGLLLHAAGAAKSTTPVGGAFQNEFLLENEIGEIDRHDLFSLLMGAGSDDRSGEPRVYIEQLALGSLRINLSYLKGKKQSWELTSQGTWIDKRAGSHSTRAEISVVGASSFHEKSQALLRWSEHTSDEEFQSDARGNFDGCTCAYGRRMRSLLSLVHRQIVTVFAAVAGCFVSECLGCTDPSARKGTAAHSGEPVRDPYKR
jgi:hypothetical protein